MGKLETSSNYAHDKTQRINFAKHSTGRHFVSYFMGTKYSQKIFLRRMQSAIYDIL
jgi:hypothetical protein